jgi:methylated-DNA-[protein]-cysteine S-methyltransferase
MQLYLESLPTHIGTVLILTDDQQQLRAVDWLDYEARMQRLLRIHYGASFELVTARAASDARRRIEAYFGGDLATLDALNVATAGTPFQRKVWTALRSIPAGETVTYGELAARIECASAVRAVGAANGSNPIGIVVPCHRVIGANKSLTGYGGGIERKRWLLQHEGGAASSCW